MPEVRQIAISANDDSYANLLRLAFSLGFKWAVANDTHIPETKYSCYYFSVIIYSTSIEARISHDSVLDPALKYYHYDNENDYEIFSALYRILHSTPLERVIHKIRSEIK